MSREITSFPLPHFLKDSLLKAGFRTANDLKDVSPSELAKECKIKPEDALLVIKSIKTQDFSQDSISSSQSSLLEGKSALELLKKETQLPPIVTCNEAIDKMLGGGVPLGKMTEFCGIPGIGKTQVGIQLAVDVQLPSVFDGVEGHCIYIDTEGSFVVERAVEIAESLVKHVQNHLVSSKEEFDSISTNFNVNSILSHIYYYRIHDYIEQLALINLLPQILNEQHNKVKLIVIDSITFHFRHDFDNMSLRTRLLNTMAQNLMFLAEKYGIAVVLINQMTTKIDSHSDHSVLVPALGESWGHNCTNRVILYWNQGQRYAYLFKSPSKKSDIAPYQVTEEGIR